MSSEGYIKLWRKLEQWPLWRDGSPEFRSVVVTAMLRANWKDEHRFVAGKMITVPRGSMLLPREELAQAANVTIKQTRIIEGRLAHDPGDGPFWALERTPAGTLYSITKYDFYQGCGEDEGTGTGTRRAPEGHPKGTPLYKKDQEGEEVPPPLSLTLSPSKPLGKDRSHSRDRSPRPAKKQAPLEQAITELCEAWPRLVEEVLEVRGAPVPAGKLRDLARDLLDGDPEQLEAAKDLCRAFLRLDDPWLADRGYQFRDIRHRLVKLKRDQQDDRPGDYVRGYEPFPSDEVER